MSIIQIITLIFKLLGIWADFRKSEVDKKKEFVNALIEAQNAQSLAMKIDDTVTKMRDEIKGELENEG